MTDPTPPPALHLTTLTLPHLPPDSHRIHLAVLAGVQNAAEIRAQLLAGNGEYEYAFVDAGMVVSTRHLLGAVVKALRGLLGSGSGSGGMAKAGLGLRTRNVHSEVVFALSPNNNISESFTKFGITDTTRNLVVVKVEVLLPEYATETTRVGEDGVRRFLGERVRWGRSVGWGDEGLWGLCEVGRVRGGYRFLGVERGVVLGGGGGGGKGRKKGKVEGGSGGVVGGEGGEKKGWGEGGEGEQRDLEVWAVGAMVLKVVG